jgi:hypothetical protein
MWRVMARVISAIFAAGLTATACARPSIPDPKAAADAYARAADRGDADAIYAMMTKDAQTSRSRDDVRKVVLDETNELKDTAKGLSAKDARVTTTARMRYADGEEASLDWEHGAFRVTSSGALPGGARTPAEALDGLRRVLARRSYAGLMRVVTPETRAMIEADLRSLVTALEHPETLEVGVAGDVATIAVPGGHHVRLKRAAGVWRVEDFD